jgi:Ca2+-binding RTX toxin-like protein
MASVTISPDTQLTGDDFWILNAVISNNERFADQTSTTGGGLLSLGTTVTNYNEYQFEANGYTYRYVGSWALNVNNGILTDSASASGYYDEVIIEKNGSQVAHLAAGNPLSIDFGTANGISLLGLGDLLNPLLGLVIGADADQSFANLHLSVTPNLPDLAGIPDDLPGGPGAVSTGTTSHDTIVGTVGGDNLSGLEGHDHLHGGAGSDILYGNQGDDTVDGGSGHDIIFGGQDQDFINGGDGHDRLISGLGSDTIHGNAGNDFIIGGNEASDPADGADTVYAGQGDDLVYGNGGDDLIFGGNGIGDLTDGSDVIFGGRGSDTIHGNAGTDTLYGQREADMIFGNEGTDWLHGGQESDTIDGGAGADTINGGLGNDLLTGGQGSDLFVFTAGQNNDVITDFSYAGGDRIDLQGQSYTVSASGSDAMLNLDGGGTIVLEGVPVAEVTDLFLVA